MPNDNPQDLASLTARIARLITDRKIVKAREIDSKAILAKAYGLDSMGTINLIVALEEEFGVEIQDDDLQLRNFSSIEKIAEFMAAKQRSVTNDAIRQEVISEMESRKAHT